jgi:hypothetical protein
MTRAGSALIDTARLRARVFGTADLDPFVAWFKRAWDTVDAKRMERLLLALA